MQIACVFVQIFMRMFDSMLAEFITLKCTQSTTPTLTRGNRRIERGHTSCVKLRLRETNSSRRCCDGCQCTPIVQLRANCKQAKLGVA